MADQAGQVNLSLGVARRDWSRGKEVFFNATRALLGIRTQADARTVLTNTVLALGGQVVPAGTAEPDIIPVDLSFGAGEPLVPLVPSGGGLRALLERHLPTLVQDARRALELCSRADRWASEASVDPLTGLPDRRMLGRAFGRLSQGDLVIMIGLDRFKEVNDGLGHHEGDRVLRWLGRALGGTARAEDTVGRYDGDKFAVVLRAGADPEAFLGRLRLTWEAAQPQPVSFSAGIALVSGAPWLAIAAADRAMYRAKQEGRHRWSWADEEAVPDIRNLVARRRPRTTTGRFRRLQRTGGGRRGPRGRTTPPPGWCPRLGRLPLPGGLGGRL